MDKDDKHGGRYVCYGLVNVEDKPREIGHGGVVVGIIGFLAPRGDVAVELLDGQNQGERFFVKPEQLLGKYEDEEGARATQRIVEAHNGPDAWGDLKTLRRHYDHCKRQLDKAELAVLAREERMRDREVECFRLNSIREEAADGQA